MNNKFAITSTAYNNTETQSSALDLYLNGDTQCLQGQNMEIEATFQKMLTGIGQLGNFCRENFKDLKHHIASLEMDAESIQGAIITLGNQADATTSALNAYQENIQTLTQYSSQAI